MVISKKIDKKNPKLSGNGKFETASHDKQDTKKIVQNKKDNQNRLPLLAKR